MTQDAHEALPDQSLFLAQGAAQVTEHEKVVLATALAKYDVNDHVQAYSRFIYAKSTSQPQLASSGTFGFEFKIFNFSFDSLDVIDYIFF